MTTFQRYIIFGLGALMGCAILGYSTTNKKISKQRQEESDISNGFVQITRLLPGQDTRARIPMMVDESVLHLKDYPSHAPNLHKRVIVCEGDESEPFWRIEEIIWTDPKEADRTKLVSRQKMAADKVLVRIDQESCDLECLKAKLNSCDMTLAHQGNGPNLYQVSLPSSDPDALSQALETLKQTDHIEAALPIYLYTIQ